MAINLTDNARRVLEARYLRRDPETGKVNETPEELFERVARGVSEAELLHGNAAAARRWEERFYAMMSSLEFLPNSPTLMNAGTALGQLSACFVLPVADSMESIFGALRDMAIIQRTGGGTGFSFSSLRQAGSLVRSTGGTASGPVAFMKIFDCATEHVKQGGKRRGANMGVLRVDHPDIDEFVHAKREGTALRNFNISVAVSDAFMAAAESGGDIAVIDPQTGRELGRRPARPLFDAICESAWATGDPGLIFLDAIARGNPTPALGTIESTNPCGEVPLLPYEACNLGSINLSLLVVDREGRSAALDWERLRALVHDATRFLDDVITVSRYPLPEIEAMTRGNRKIGLGLMGFAEALVRLGIPYGAREALEFGSELMAFVAREARASSTRLAAERGVFPNWTRSRYAASGERVRNATQTCIAPTGTIGIIANTSPSIEPFFALAYRRVGVLGGQTLAEFNPVALRELQRRGLATREVLEHVARHGTLAGAPGVPEEVRMLLRTALELSPEQHVRMQAAFQRHVDNAVSKTVNLPEDATVADVASVYRLAHQLGCKGVTVFRYGSKGTQVLEVGANEPGEAREHFARCDPTACQL